MGSEWVEVTVGEIAPLSYGKALPWHKRKHTGSVPVYGSNGIIDFHDEELTKDSAVIIGQRGTVGTVYYSSKPCWPIDTTFFISDKDFLFVRYLYYLFKFLRLDRIDTDTVVPSIDKNVIHALKVFVPKDKAEQRAIARILGTLDDKIEMNCRMNETLGDMARELFRSWFVDFEPVRAKMEGRWKRGQSLPGLPADLYDFFPDRLVKSEGFYDFFSDRIVKSEFGEIPEGWRYSTIGEEVKVYRGDTPSTKEPKFWEGGQYCWATPADLSVLKSPVLLDTNRKITAVGLAKINSGLLPVGTVLLSSRASIGYLAINEVPIAIGTGIIAMKCNGTLPNVFMLLWCMENRDVIVSYAYGSVIQGISINDFKSLRVVVPSDSVLTGFTKLVVPLYRQLVKNERESRTLAQLRDFLLPKLISGELRVKDAEAFLKERGL